MALQASGPISFSQIVNEFGIPPGKNLGAYRISQNVGSLTDLRLDTGVPGPGEPIRFSSFYSKRLNIVVDFYSGSSETRPIARAKYDLINFSGQSTGVTVIGGFTQKPSRSENKKVIINVNKLIGSAKGNRDYTAFRTGSGWETNTQLELEIGSSGIIVGAGGDGGNGGSNGVNDNLGSPGTSGSSALGIEYPCNVRNKGYIQSGSGGGAGGTAYVDRRRNNRFGFRSRTDTAYSGGGGGGGAGFPLGNGGGPGIARGGDEGRNRRGNPGQPATTYLQGGAGGDSTCLVDFPNQTRCIQAGGGAGGSLGTPGNTNNTVSGGTRGRAIIIFNDGSGTTIVNSGTGTVVGPTIYNTNPQ